MTDSHAAYRPSYTTLFLQDEATRWLKVLKADGFALPERVIVYTNLRKLATAAAFTVWQRGGPYDGDHSFGETGLSKWGVPIIYIRTRSSRVEVRDDPRRTLVHQLLHQVVPRLPHWKVYALESHLCERREVGLTSRVRSLADYRRERAMVSVFLSCACPSFCELPPSVCAFSILAGERR